MKTRKILAILLFVCISVGLVSCKQEDTRLAEKYGYVTVETVKKDYSNLEVIKVACIGDSITAGGYWRDNLMGGLDERFEVKGFGKGGSTLLFTGLDDYGNPGAYRDQPIYQLSLESEAHIVVIMLGTNDSKDINWSQTEETDGKIFVDNYIELVKTYQSLPTKPKVFVAFPPTVFAEAYGITNSTIEEEIIPAIKAVADATGAGIIDTHAANADYSKEYSDGVHPSSEKGRQVLADAVSAAILEDVADE